MKNIVKRIFFKFKRTILNLGFFGPDQFFQISKFSDQSRRLLIVAPGELSIPPMGWGAVETIIWETVGIYEEKKIEVWLLNSKKPSSWRKATKQNFGVVLCHGDTFAPKIKKYFPNSKTVGLTHYGYAAFPHKWHHSFGRTISGLLELDVVCCLNSEIAETLSLKYPTKKFIVSPNGSSFKPEVGRDINGPILCVGKVEERKNQYLDYLDFKQRGLDINFIGAIVDPRVKEMLQTDPEARKSFLGSMDRETLARKMKNYSALMLNSRGEADALVLYEAQLAGLPIIVSEAGIGAQDVKLPWVFILKNDFKSEDLLKFLREESLSAKMISDYARNHYRWDQRNSSLTNFISKLFDEVNK